MSPTVAGVVAVLDELYPPATAAAWDKVGLVLGEPAAPVRSILCVVDVVPETVAEAADRGVDMIVSHHPLLLRGVSSVAPTTYAGRIVHDLIRAGIALHVAHTNADVAVDGVNEALADLLGLGFLRPFRPDGLGRVGTLPAPLRLADLVRHVAATLPATAWGVRATGDPEQIVTTLAVASGSGSDCLPMAAGAGADAILTSDVKHHYASEHVAAGGPAVIEAAHWATEWPWLPRVAGLLAAKLDVETFVSTVRTDPWTLHSTGAE
ncbi:Nif3-like dinuclear metal center hexameric protein [Hamadaea tsunoensis]|uniref:Nif3-like dinuclear metal center hexameric protein n=1 Tax=Hamadaea tsunoensis TaxID=53368 RepID=UPI0003FC8D86|nr:Nif3-like dinuclear metal center hexameric protein [Hamadaea tsunoensis]